MSLHTHDNDGFLDGVRTYHRKNSNDTSTSYNNMEPLIHCVEKNLIGKVIEENDDVHVDDDDDDEPKQQQQQQQLGPLCCTICGNDFTPENALAHIREEFKINNNTNNKKDENDQQQGDDIPPRSYDYTSSHYSWCRAETTAVNPNFLVSDISDSNIATILLHVTCTTYPVLPVFENEKQEDFSTSRRVEQQQEKDDQHRLVLLCPTSASFKDLASHITVRWLRNRDVTTLRQQLSESENSQGRTNPNRTEPNFLFTNMTGSIAFLPRPQQHSFKRLEYASSESITHLMAKVGDQAKLVIPQESIQQCFCHKVIIRGRVEIQLDVVQRIEKKSPLFGQILTVMRNFMFISPSSCRLPGGMRRHGLHNDILPEPLRSAIVASESDEQSVELLFYHLRTLKLDENDPLQVEEAKTRVLKVTKNSSTFRLLTDEEADLIAGMEFGDDDDQGDDKKKKKQKTKKNNKTERLLLPRNSVPEPYEPNATTNVVEHYKILSDPGLKYDKVLKDFNDELEKEKVENDALIESLLREYHEQQQQQQEQPLEEVKAQLTTDGKDKKKKSAKKETKKVAAVGKKKTKRK